MDADTRAKVQEIYAAIMRGDFGTARALLAALLGDNPFD